MSTSDVVVVSAGGGGWWSALAARAAGRTVRMVSHGPTRPPPVWSLGPISDPGPVGRALLGRLSAYEVGRAVLARGHVVGLPFERTELGRLVPPAAVPALVADLARARAKTEAAQLVGGGGEQRTYRDWVVRRFGAVAYAALFAPYASRRFGPPEEVLAGLARVHHDGSWAAHVPDSGWGAVVEGFSSLEPTLTSVERVAPGVVRTADGEIEGEVWIDAPPAMVLDWLDPELAAELRFEVGRMPTRPAAQVRLRGGGELPYETHLLDADASAWRLRRPGLLAGGAGLGEALVADVAGAPAELDDAALVQSVVRSLAGVAGVDGAGADVLRLPYGAPVWERTHFARLRVWVTRLAAADLLPVGARGLAAPLDVGQELAIAGALAGEEAPSIRAVIRDHVEPPTIDGPERAHLTRFIVR